MKSMNLKTMFRVVFASVLLILAVPASAQFATNSKAPINGSADSVDYRQEVTVFSGQVDIRQADVRILSDTMRIYSGNDSAATEAFNDIRRIEAVGNFYYITPEQEVRGEKGVYEAKTDTFTVTGDVILLQGKDNVVTGERLVYNLSSNQARVVGTCKGRKCGRKGRVNILIKNSGNQNN